MKKIVYVVEEINTKGDDFDYAITFDINEARLKLEDSAYRGYKLNKKTPEDTKYYIFGYEIDTAIIDEDEEYDINDAKSLYTAYLNSVLSPDFTFEEEYKCEEI